MSRKTGNCWELIGRKNKLMRFHLTRRRAEIKRRIPRGVNNTQHTIQWYPSVKSVTQFVKMLQKRKNWKNFWTASEWGGWMLVCVWSSQRGGSCRTSDWAGWTPTETHISLSVLSQSLKSYITVTQNSWKRHRISRTFSYLQRPLVYKCTVNVHPHTLSLPLRQPTI